MTTPLVDGFGRVQSDLRISVTDRCNLRCTYCMPEDGLPWIDRAEVLSFEEIERVVSLMAQRLGLRSVRLTGGEPTVRHDLHELVRRLAAVEGPAGRLDLAMTTNGVTLGRDAKRLRAAGLQRINISLDTLRPERFVAMTRRDELDRVLDGIDAAVAAGFEPVKVNAVVQSGVNDDELVELARFGRQRGVEMRFIEFMPLDADGRWERGDVVAKQQIVERIAAHFPVRALERTHAPADRFEYLDGAGSFGVIASVTEAFCGSCDRLRLSSEGTLRNCLYALEEYDLRAALRADADDDELSEIITRCVAHKWAGHAIGQVHFIRPFRSMSQLGG
ncbi:MAG: GTP 3',8-cyclase MoaA [Actinobacteria bacterium]|nr:GTP 3',8-cyclase MoaA [Actinomycetota bacterium]